MRISEQSWVSMGLLLVLCGVTWRARGIENNANAALSRAKEMEAYLKERREITERRWGRVERSMILIKIKLHIPLEAEER